MFKINKRKILYKIIIFFLLFLSSYASTLEDYERYDSLKLLPKNIKDMPGLVSEHYFLQADYLEAIKVLEKIESLTIIDLVYYRFALISLRQKKYEKFKYFMNKISDRSILINDELIADIYEYADVKTRKFLYDLLAKNQYFEKKLEENCPYYCQNIRRQRAKNLFNFLNDKEFPLNYRTKALFELYVLLPEVFSEEDISNLGLLPIKNSLKIKDFLKRVNLLMIFGKNDEAKSSIEFIKDENEKPFNKDKCEVYYQEARINKNLRQTTLARAQFQKLINFCDEPLRIKARYMDLSLASVAKNMEDLPKFDEFVRDYPTSSLSDDVLIFKIELLNALGEKNLSILDYNKIIEDYPNGDMIEKALFDLAFLYANDHKLAIAIKYLNKLNAISKEGSLAKVKANYWIARLLLFNDPNSFSPIDNSSIKYAKFLLIDVAKSYPYNYYSWLSLELLRFLKEPIEEKNLDLVKNNAWPAINWDKDLLVIYKYLTLGFRKEALALLNEIEVEAKNFNKLLGMAFLYSYANKPVLGYQRIIKCYGNSIEPIKELFPLSMVYPKVFNEEINFVASRMDLSKELIWGLIRQESSFFSLAVSPKGAKGLSQLMPSSAKESALALGIKEFDLEHLFEPKVNLLLGSSLLLKYWKKFKTFPLTLAAYNAGPNAVASWLKKDPKIPLDTFVEKIPYKETNNYVISVLGAVFSYQRLYGLGFSYSLGLINNYE